MLGFNLNNLLKGDIGVDEFLLYYSVPYQNHWI